MNVTKLFTPYSHLLCLSFFSLLSPFVVCCFSFFSIVCLKDINACREKKDDRDALVMHLQTTVQEKLKNMQDEINQIKANLFEVTEVTQQNQENTKQNQESITKLKLFLIQTEERHTKATNQLKQNLESTKQDVSQLHDDLESTRQRQNNATNRLHDTQQDLESTKQDLDDLEDAVNHVMEVSKHVENIVRNRCDAIEANSTSIIETLLNNRDTTEYRVAESAYINARRSLEEQELARDQLEMQTMVYSQEQRLCIQIKTAALLAKEQATKVFEQAMKTCEQEMQQADTKKNIAQINLRSSLNTFTQKTKVYERDQEAALQAIQNFEDHKKNTAENTADSDND